jgi:hypothetical protein
MVFNMLSPEERYRRQEHGRRIRRGWSPDLEVCGAAGRRGAGTKVARLVLERHGCARMRPGNIPGWWYGLAIKPDPRPLFEVADWPEEFLWQGKAWHMQRQSLVYGRYKYRPWFNAFARGISWYQLWRERENMTNPDPSAGLNKSDNCRTERRKVKVYRSDWETD